MFKENMFRIGVWKALALNKLSGKAAVSYNKGSAVHFTFNFNNNWKIVIIITMIMSRIRMVSSWWERFKNMSAVKR